MKQQKDLRGFYWMMNRTEDAAVLATKKPRYRIKTRTNNIGNPCQRTEIEELLEG